MKETQTFDRDKNTLDKSGHIRYSFQNPMIDPSQATPQTAKPEGKLGDLTSSNKKNRSFIIGSNISQIQSLNKSILEDKFDRTAG